LITKCVICGITDHCENDICSCCRMMDFISSVRRKTTVPIRVALTDLKNGYIQVRLGVPRNVLSESVKNKV